MRVLVVDDSKPVRGILSKMLEQLGFQIVTASDGREAIDALKSSAQSDLMILNWNMPVLNGEQVLHWVRQDPRYTKLPVIVTSGSSDARVMDSAIAAGANDFLTKPIESQTLRSRIEVFKPGSTPTPQSSLPKPKEFEPKPPESVSKPEVVTAAPKVSIPRGRVRVMIVDDSVVVRGIVTSLIEQDPELMVVATATDGRVAMDKLASANPDVVLLDIEMPIMNGYETLKAIRQVSPKLPVIMFSSLTERGARATLDAIMLGANDYVMKPGGTYMRDVEAGKETIRNELLPKIKQFGRAASLVKPSGTAVSTAMTQEPRPITRKPSVVAIAVSTGGPQALADLLPGFARKCPVPIVIVQHMPPLFTQYLAERLKDGWNLPIQEAAEGDLVQAGQIYLAPGGHHMVVKSIGGKIRIGTNQLPPENSCRPSADVLFRSIASVYGAASLAIVLTGMGDDGMRGCGEIRSKGGKIIAQDEASSVVWGMPGNVVRAGFADKVLPLSRIALEITSMLR